MAYSIAAILYVPSFYSYLSFVCIFFVSFPFLVSYKYTKDIETNIKFSFPKVPYFIVILGLAAGLANLYVIANNAGGSLSDIFSIDGIKAISYKSTTIRYEGSSTTNSGNPFILAISLFLLFIVGLNQEKNNGIKTVLLFLPIVLYTVLTTEKWPSFLAFVFFFCGVFYSNSLKDVFRFLIRNSKYLVLVGMLAISTLMFRSGKSESILSLLNMICHYLLSSYYGLGYWLVNEYNEVPLTLGKYTLIGPLSFFPSLTGVFRSSGVYSESYYVYGNASNIYTAFRYLIQDFSVLGLFLINSIISMFYVFFTKSGNYAVSESIRLVLLFCAMISLTVTIAVYNSVLLSIFMCTSYVFLCLVRNGSK